ncbi:MAG: 2Fe-2S iron-sulfur cluster-binding protein [Pseudorhodoplanes sp.]|uniref:2Fe-2S iron-sulfur cluster-binding protein n=1 Tax=Pseudorhodoplanes sp. TaxID=1934341 RepID=UPI003D11255B
MLDKPSATHQVKLLPEGNTLACPPTQTLLDACIADGVPISYNCRSGECGECMASLVSGEVHELPGADPAIFTDAHRSQGKILTCMCFPRSALTLDIPLQSGAPAIRPAAVNAMVQRVERLTPSIFGVTVETPWPIEYYAGQAFEWVVPGIAPNRTYSAANRPGSDVIEFHVRVYPGGRIGAFVSDLTAGQPLQLMGPYGQFRLSGNDWRPALCVAGGTGLAPVMSLLEHAAATKDRRAIRLFYGARSQDELYGLDRIEALGTLLPDFTFTPVLSDEPQDSGWTGARGLVTDILAEQVGDAFGLEAYLCGPPLMIDAAVDVLTRFGALEQDIRSDRFVQAKTSA